MLIIDARSWCDTALNKFKNPQFRLWNQNNPIKKKNYEVKLKKYSIKKEESTWVTSQTRDSGHDIEITL
jgi:hypothetical protein